MNNIFLGLKFSFSYFSKLPIKLNEKDDLSKEEVLKYFLLFFPFVGLILASISILVFNIFSSLGFLSAIIASIIYMTLYGFLHTEGVVDVVDAIYAKHSGKDAYKIIKEPSIGAIGALYTFSFVLLKVSVLSFLLYEKHFLAFLVIAIFSRQMVLFTIYSFDFKSTFVSLLKKSLSKKSFFISSIIVLLIALAFIQSKAIILFVLSFLFTLFFVKFLKKSLGFLNGDCLGTVLETNEVLLAIMFLLLV